MLQYLCMAVIALTASLTAAAAGPGLPCARRNEIVPLLKDAFGEVQAWRGLSSAGHLMEVFVSPAGGWTILLSRPDGVSCLVDEGKAWVTVQTGTPARDSAQPLR